VLRAVHLPPLKESRHYGSEFALVQAAAFEVLAYHGQIELLLEERHRPAFLFDTSLEVLLDTISDQHLQSMVPLLEGLVQGMKSERNVVKTAWVLADLGHIDEAQQVIEKLRREALFPAWIAHEIIQGVHRLPAPNALSVIDEILSQGDEITHNRSGYLRRLCIEALGRIGTPGACERLGQIAWADAEGVGVYSELALRQIEFLAPTDKESWLVDLINEHPRMERAALRRALETLGVIGSEDSLPLLQQHFRYSDSPGLQTTCFWAIHSIFERAGVLWFNGEEEVAGMQRVL
jgi:hypothetical protein